MYAAADGTAFLVARGDSDPRAEVGRIGPD